MTKAPHIVDELRRRIVAGELTPGDLLPSTRQIIREWGVAMATASKVLSRLQEEGLARAVPGVGTVVAGRDERPPGADLTRQRIVQTAIRIADGEGLAAVSMRRIATELGSTTSAMSLYRHVDGKEDLVHLMTDAVYGEDPPAATVPRGWRPRLELALRQVWGIHRRHPWLAQAVSLTRPQFVPNGMAHTDRVLQALDGLGLDARTMLHAVVSLMNFVHGTAVSLEAELQARTETGITEDEWMRARQAELGALLAAGAFPALAKVLGQPDIDLDLDSVFEFGLRNHLDGIAVLVARARAGRRD
ncbi:TetR/AcrR family transcriptional regulator C-terminal domain-containing protein [Actinomadura sp. ATCC 31491]|uniref:TetR/AcrR family transcriptional regulator C-terminal domain-containing protein n=1 Tax=Actinomadura luzonensis TaxID=2805427 RepID=A0ABT0FZX7_9ACTN|nr:TetR/AcrR family transcriptional regulator C-terminal domain-containing protein [Actinomadura luzonensis]MCK2217894.1 TetR/AcrR family transcriptional regulator C-terminal domain-containing protein [Actinomadura luzonensis]